MTRCVAILGLFVPAFSQELALQIPPVKTTIDFGSQPITVGAWGSISGGNALFRFRIAADFSDLQQHITDVLAGQLNKSDKCGERLSVERATLVPEADSGVMTVYAHYERWACVKALGKQVAKRLVGGNATLPVKLTPSVAESQLKLTAEVGAIEADGSLGEVLRSGSFGPSLQEKIRASILAAIQKSCLKATLPPAIASVAAITAARFDGENGRLLFRVEGEVRLPAKDIRRLIESPRPGQTP